MQQNLVYCLNHPNSFVTHICTGLHLCPRKLCSECQYQHQQIIDGTLIIPLQTLKNKLKEDIEQFELNNSIRFDRAKLEFKQAISQMEYTFSSLIQEMVETSKKIFEEIEKVDKSLLDLLSSNIEESSYSELYNISEIIQMNHLNLWQQQKQQCYQMLDEKKNTLIELCEQVAIEMRETIKSTHLEKIGLNVFENSILFGISNSDFACINNEIISKQGLMKLNQRRGFIETLGFSQKEDRFITLQIVFQFGKIFYVKDGKILNIEEYNDQSSMNEVFNNYDKLCNLKWEGEIENNKKVGLWNAFWDKQYLGFQGLYDKKGRKQGQWIEPCNNYSTQFQVVYTGNYINGKKQGNWNLMRKNSKGFVMLGGGNYNQSGEKRGKWVELYDEILNYQNQLIINVGKYSGGKKTGCWKIQMYNESIFTKNRKIGGGKFENGMKNGEWTEIHYSFKEEFQVTFVGCYKNGYKIGQWNTYLIQNNEQQIIGEGTYNNFGKKDGFWSELSNYFHLNHLTIYYGNYKNGQKYGKWSIKNKKKQSNLFQIIGDGEYDEQGLRNGDWIELFQNYDEYCEITYKGKYINGLKQGQWDIMYQNDKIGGGNHDQEGEKSGKWTEIYENFNIQTCNILYVGNYMKGKKIGQWQQVIQSNGEVKEFICGNYESNGLKNGKWIEINYPSLQQSQKFVEYQNGIQKENYEQSLDIQI